MKSATSPRTILLNSSFISKRKDQIETNVPHLRLGVASMAAYLRCKGFEVSILDPQLHQMSLDGLTTNILSSKADIVGLSAYTIEIKDAAAIAKHLKLKKPEIKTIIGGYHVSALPIESMRSFPFFDVGVIGEGEQTLTELVSGLPIESIKGIVYRNSDGNPTLSDERTKSLCFEALPFPAWDLYDLVSYRRYDPRLPIEPLRRCPFNCIFCFRACGTQPVYKQPDQFVDELKHAIHHYDYGSFLFQAGTFPLKRSHAQDICERIINAQISISWTASCRVDLIDFQLLKLMKRSGCHSLQFGIESGDEKILSFCSKGITPEKALQAVKMCKKAGIRPGLNFILGLPLETRQSLKNTYRLAVQLLKYADSVNFAILVPYPGTEVYRMALKKQAGLGLRSRDWSDFGKQIGLVLEHPNFSYRQLQKIQSRFYLSTYARKPMQAFRFFSPQRALMLFRHLLLRT